MISKYYPNSLSEKLRGNFSLQALLGQQIILSGAQIVGALKDLVQIDQVGKKETQGAQAIEFFQKNNASEFDDISQLLVIIVFLFQTKSLPFIFQLKGSSFI